MFLFNLLSVLSQQCVPIIPASSLSSAIFIGIDISILSDNGFITFTWYPTRDKYQLRIQHRNKYIDAGRQVSHAHRFKQRLRQLSLYASRIFHIIPSDPPLNRWACLSRLSLFLVIIIHLYSFVKAVICLRTSLNTESRCSFRSVFAVKYTSEPNDYTLLYFSLSALQDIYIMTCFYCH